MATEDKGLRMPSGNMSQERLIVGPTVDHDQLTLASEIKDSTENSWCAFLRFRIGSFWMALPVEAVEEICANVAATPIPKAPIHIPGVINLRGRALPLLNLKIFFELLTEDVTDDLPTEDKVQDTLFQRIVVVSSEGMRVGILCDQVSSVVEIPKFQRKKPEVIQDKKLCEFAWAEMIYHDAVFLILDISKLLQSAKVHP